MAEHATIRGRRGEDEAADVNVEGAVGAATEGLFHGEMVRSVGRESPGRVDGVGNFLEVERDLTGCVVGVEGGELFKQGLVLMDFS